MTSRRRQRVFLTARPTVWSLLVPVVALVAGVLFATSGRAAGGGVLRDDSDSIAERIRTGTRSNHTKATRVDALQSQVDALTKRAAQSNAQVQALTAEADGVAPAAGRTAVTGPALEVSLNDSPLPTEKIPQGFTVDDVVVHQQDVQAVVNSLWASGAEAMMLMDQRVIATSAVRCVGNTLILKGRVYSPPYVITAIGDVDAMRAGLEQDKQVKTYRQYVSAVGLGYQVRGRSEVTLPAYSGSITTEYARRND